MLTDSKKLSNSPPPFLSTRKTGREQLVRSPVHLTPLESQLRDLVVSLYSDTDKTRGPDIWHTQDQLSTTKDRCNRATGSERAERASGGIFHSMSTRPDSVGIGLGAAHGDRKGIEPRRRSEGDRSSETGSEDSTFTPKLVREALELSVRADQGQQGINPRPGASHSSSLPPTPLTMSGSESRQSKQTASLLASFSVPTFFSADDTAVDATDPEFPSISTLDSLPYVPVGSDDGASNPGQPPSDSSAFGEHNLPLALRRPVEFPGQHFPVASAEDPDTSFTWEPLYSHSDSGKLRHSSSDSGESRRDNKPRLQVVESFKIEPGLLQRQSSPTSVPTSQLPPSSPRPMAERTRGGSDVDGHSSAESADLPSTVKPPHMQNPCEEKPPQVDQTFHPVVSVSKTDDGEEAQPWEQDTRSTGEEEEQRNLDETEQAPESARRRSLSPESADSETASVISIQQLTRSLHEPLSLSEELPRPVSAASSLPGGVKSRDDRDKTPTPSETTLVLPPSIPRPTTVTPSKYAPSQPQHRYIEPPASPNLPKHLQPLPSPKHPHSQVASPLRNRHGSLSSELSQSSQLSELAMESPGVPTMALASQPPGPSQQQKLLEAQLAEMSQAKAYLEGQLESVMEECKATLKDRAALQSKLAKVEAELAESIAREKAQLEPKEPSSKTKEVEHLRDRLAKAESALGNEQKGALALKNELARERQQNKRAENELVEAQTDLSTQKLALASLKEKDKSLRVELDRITEENQELECKLSSLQASYEALEGTKSWLHDQLQESLESKMKLQEELKHSKAAAIAQGMKTDQLVREREGFQKRVAELQKGVLEDKAKLVSELETIEADVLSREGAFTQLVSEKAQLENEVKMKEKEVEKLTSELAETQAAKQGLEDQLSDIGESQDGLSFRARTLERENGALKEKLRALEQELDVKSSDVVELEKLKGTLQERLRQSEAALVSKDGTLQGVNDAKEIFKQELEMVRQGQDTTERELEEARREIGELENQLKAVVDEGKGKEARIRALAQAQKVGQADKQALQVRLEAKDAELAEKQAELSSLEQQSKELMAQLKSIQDEFQTVASERGDINDSVAEKDRVIAHLADEKERADEEIVKLREHQEQLERKSQQLQQDKARLQGEMEALSGSSVEDLQKALQDKTTLQAELNSLKVGHQNEMIKAQAKLDRTEAELKSARRQVGKTEKQLQKALDAKEEELRDLQESHSKAEARIRDADRKLRDALREKGTAEVVLKATKDKVGNLESRNELLTKHCEELAEQLQHEGTQRVEVERASGMVASKLKQNAEETEKKLQDRINEMALEVERLRGRLTGMSTAQSTMREHAGSLEVALAERESSLIKLSAQAQKVLQEKEMEDRAFMEEIATLKQQLSSSRTQVEDSRAEVSAEKKRADSLEEEVSQYKTQMATQVGAGNIPALHQELSVLSKAKHELQQEVGSLKSQLVVAKTSAVSAQRDLADKRAQVEILKQEVQMAQEQRGEACAELRQLQERLRAGESRHAMELEELRRVESSAVDVPGGYRPGVFDTSLSSIGLEETDRPPGTLCVCV